MNNVLLYFAAVGAMLVVSLLLGTVAYYGFVKHPRLMVLLVLATMIFVPTGAHADVPPDVPPCRVTGSCDYGDGAGSLDPSAVPSVVDNGVIGPISTPITECGGAVCL